MARCTRFNIMRVSNMWYVCGFLRVLQFSPPMKTYHHNIAEILLKVGFNHKPNQTKPKSKEIRVTYVIEKCYSENHVTEMVPNLGDNSIVFENFTASIGDLMVTNWVYWRCGYLQPSNQKFMPWNFHIQYNYLHSNVIMCIAILLTRWCKR